MDASYECIVCKLVFATNEEMQSHLMKSHNAAEVADALFHPDSNEDPFAGGATIYGEDINEVSELFQKDALSQQQLLQDDVGKHEFGSGGVFGCSKCSVIFATADLLTRHKQRNHSTGEHKCPLCTYSSNSRKCLSSHKRRHNKGLQRKCNRCNVRFKNRANLNRHKKTIHSTARPFSCNLCRLTFKLKYQVDRHRVVHFPPLYMCNYCGKKFRWIYVVKTHIMAVHNGVKRYSCRFCEKKYGYRASLKRHVSSCLTNIS